MNQDQVTGLLRILLPSLLSFAVGRGWIDAGTAGDVTAAIITLVGAAWSIWAHTQTNKVKAVAAMPEVAKVEVVPTKAGLDLANAVGSTPNAVVTVGAH